MFVIQPIFTENKDQRARVSLLSSSVVGSVICEGTRCIISMYTTGCLQGNEDARETGKYCTPEWV